MNKDDFIEAKPLIEFLDGWLHYLESCIKYSVSLSNDEKIKQARYKGLIEAYRFIQVHIEKMIDKNKKK